MERIKVLYTNLTKEEKDFIEKKLKNARVKRFYEHAIERMIQKRISKRDVYRVLEDYNIIEVNYKGKGDIRVLLRGNKVNDYGFCTCIVFDIYTSEIVTAYKNHIMDTHRTLKANRYSEIHNLKGVTY